MAVELRPVTADGLRAGLEVGQHNGSLTVAVSTIPYNGSKLQPPVAVEM